MGIEVAKEAIWLEGYVEQLGFELKKVFCYIVTIKLSFTWKTFKLFILKLSILMSNTIKLGNRFHCGKY